jgi:hypothetical protein
MNSRAKKISTLAICFALVAVLMAVTIGSSVSAVPETVAVETVKGEDFKLPEPVPDLGRQVPINLPVTDGKKGGNTNYEEVKEVGFNPQDRTLEAVIAIKQSSGYEEHEYVGFYVDWNDNGKFSTYGGEVVGLDSVYITNPGKTDLPLSYALDVAATPPPSIKNGAVVKVRAILSYAEPPTGPNFVPTWGNVIERNIRIDAIR